MIFVTVTQAFFCGAGKKKSKKAIICVKNIKLMAKTSCKTDKQVL